MSIYGGSPRAASAVQISMIDSYYLSVAFLSLALPLFTYAGPLRHSGPVNLTRADLQRDRRDTNAQFTFYSVGLGACGITNTPSDFVVALNACEYDAGSHCFEEIIITALGKTTTAQITDECPACPCGGLDMSVGLFSFFAPLSAGLITGSWEFENGAA